MSKKTKDETKVQTAPVHPFKRVRRAGVPLSFFETADPAALMQACQRALNGNAGDIPIVQYDVSATLRHVNKPGETWLKTADGQEILAACPMGSAAVFQAMAIKPPAVGDSDNRIGAVVFVHNAHKILEDFTATQAMWNCRDSFKSAGSTMVLLGCASRVPAELKNDVPLFTEEVPDETEIGRIIDSVFGDAGIDPASIDKPKVIDGLLGYLSAFGVEQSLCLSLRPKSEGSGVDIDQLWALKVAALKATAGLEITLPKVGFEAMAGNEGVKRLIRYQLNGLRKPRAIFWLDEIEKMVQGAQAGNLDGGASMAVMEQFLFWTAAHKVRAFLLLGIPGAGKSLTCQVTAGEAHCPLLRGSLSGVKGGIVGSTEANIRAMLNSVDAIAQGEVFVLATCNSLDALSPELMGRFNPIIFYDFPTSEENSAIWAHYMAKFQVQGPIPRVVNWVGREIELCCERAHTWQISLVEAAETVIPSCIANAGKLEALRRSANGRFSSAAQPGLYQCETTQATATGRKLNLS